MAEEAKGKGGIFYGWWIIVACFFIYGFHTILMYGLTIYAPFILPQLGWTRADFGTIASVVTWSSLAFGVLAGWFIDRYGPKLSMIIGASIGIVGVYLFTTMTTKWEAYLYLAGIMSLAIMLQGLLPSQTLARRWFLKHAALATGILMASFGLIAAICFPVLMRLANEYDWRTVALYSGIAIEILVILLALTVVRDNPEKMGLHMDGMTDEQAAAVQGFIGKTLASEPHMTRVEALKTPQFWIISIGIGLVGAVFFGFMTHITMIGLSVGMKPSQSALVMSAFALTSVLGRFGGGWLADKTGKRRSFIIFGTLSGLAYLYAWLFASSPTLLIIFAACAGIFFSPVLVVIAPFMGDMFGRLYLGSILGLVYMVQGIISGIGPFIAGQIAHTTNSYQLLYLLGALMNIIFICAVLMTKPTRVEQAMSKPKTTA